jgi:hypothetical protein
MNSLLNDANQIMSGKRNNNADSADQIYYNIIIRNEDTPSGTQLVFSENRTVPVVSNPSDYDLACVRMLVPAFNIPLLFFPETNFYVKLKYGAVEVQTDLQWIPNASANPFANLNKLPVYDWSEITKSLNNALELCKTTLDGLAPTAAFDPPFMTYDAPSELFSLNGEIAGYDQALGSGNYIEIIFSAKLFEYYTNLSDFFLGQFETQVLIYDQFDNTKTFNGKPYYSMQQSQPSLELFADIQKIVVFSNSIPVVQELQPTQDDVTRRILFDFNITGIPDKGSISYFPQGPLRYYSLVSSYPLKQIDCEIRWESKSGETFPIFINQDTTASVKLLFQKKIALRLDDQ